MEKKGLNYTQQKLKSKVEITGASMVQVLRDVVKPKGKRGTWLQYLNDKQLVEVYHRLKLKQKPVQIVRVVQKDWKVMNESTPQSMWRALAAFKKKALPLIDQVEDKQDRRSLSNKAARLKEELDSLGTLRWAVDIQAGRFAAASKKEDSMGGIQLKETNKTFKELVEALNVYIQTEIRLGVLDSAPSEFNVNIKHKFDGVLEATIGDDSVAMVEATNKFLKDADDMCLTLTMDDDGRYEVSDATANACDLLPALPEGVDDEESKD